MHLQTCKIECDENSIVIRIEITVRGAIGFKINTSNINLISPILNAE